MLAPGVERLLLGGALREFGQLPDVPISQLPEHLGRQGRDRLIEPLLRDPFGDGRAELLLRGVHHGGNDVGSLWLLRLRRLLTLFQGAEELQSAPDRIGRRPLLRVVENIY